MADLPKESAVFLLAGRKTIGNREELLVRRVVEIPKSEYRIQSDVHLDISPRVINGLVALCEQNGLGAILCHSHPTDSPYSPSDDNGEKRIAETIWKFVPEAPVGSLLISPGQYQARIWLPGKAHSAVQSITVVGRHIHQIGLNGGGKATSFNRGLYDRQVLAFGAQGQEAVSRTKIAIVGVGGTGSPTAEQAVRLGVKDIVLVDPDTLSDSNITRVYGSFYRDIIQPWWKRLLPINSKQSKVDMVARHLRSIAPDAKIVALQKNIVTSSAARALLDRDVIFCCTDEHWGRSIVNQIAHQYMIPVINMGVQIDSKDGVIRGASGSIHIIRPDAPCLWCYEFLSGKRIRAESLPPELRDSELREGYVENLDAKAPSVVSLTTTLSGHAVTAFLQLVTDFRGAAGGFHCLNYSIMEGVVRRGSTTTDERCICKAAKGYGDMKGLPTI